MIIHASKHTQVVEAPIADCWAFFSDPRNLAKITPPEMDFTVVGDLPEQMYAGMLIEYRVRAILGLRMRWLSEITHLESGRYFIDEQRAGPYALWHHEHWFAALDDHRTEIRDVIHYALPLGPWSEPAHALSVAPQLAKIFRYRAESVGRLFPKTE